MDVNLLFLNLEGLDDYQISQLNDLLHPSNGSSEIEFPWNNSGSNERVFKKGIISLNVHAPAFQTCVLSRNKLILEATKPNYPLESYSNGSDLPNLILRTPYVSRQEEIQTTNTLPLFSNGIKSSNSYLDEYHPFPQSHTSVSDNSYQKALNSSVPTSASTSSFKLNPTVSCFVPQSIKKFDRHQETENFVRTQYTSPAENVVPSSASQHLNDKLFTETSDTVNPCEPPSDGESVLKPSDKLELSEETASVCTTQNVAAAPSTPVTNGTVVTSSAIVDSPKIEVTTQKAITRSWAQIVTGKQQSAEKTPHSTKTQSGNEARIRADEDKERESSSIEEDKLALVLGKHLYELELNFQTVCLQPRGLINRRNWCYINATLQALMASSPFYTLIRNLPLGPNVERGKSATPVIDSMVKVAYEFSQLESSQEELQLGSPFQPDFIYDMLRDLKSDCLKGLQEDAEEFLSFILNNMHDEMVKIIKNYEKSNCIDTFDEVKENGDLSGGGEEEEWQVIGSKHKSMVTRKVAEHKTPISDLLGGQIKSFLTTSGCKTSASIQPFFTLQLDIQAENVTSVSEALKEMTVKEPIQGYTCAKTKQEVEAFSHIALQKLPPVLILHLKRFVYNINGGCKKVMKKTDYPLELEINRELFSPDVKKSQRIRMYRLFAVMYHDGEEAIKGHYICDVYNHGSQSWVRCDDRQITVVSESQVLSHNPPRVPYLLFYQES